jgi:hypothetical protein
MLIRARVRRIRGKVRGRRMVGLMTGGIGGVMVVFRDSQRCVFGNWTRPIRVIIAKWETAVVWHKQRTTKERTGGSVAKMMILKTPQNHERTERADAT